MKRKRAHECEAHLLATQESRDLVDDLREIHNLESTISAGLVETAGIAVAKRGAAALTWIIVGGNLLVGGLVALFAVDTFALSYDYRRRARAQQIG